MRGQLDLVVRARGLHFRLFLAEFLERSLFLVDPFLHLGALDFRPFEFPGDECLLLGLFGMLQFGGSDFLASLHDAVLVFRRFAGAERDQFTQFLQAGRDRRTLLLPGFVLLGLGGQFDARLGQRGRLLLLLADQFIEVEFESRHRFLGFGLDFRRTGHRGLEPFVPFGIALFLRPEAVHFALGIADLAFQLRGVRLRGALFLPLRRQVDFRFLQGGAGLFHFVGRVLDSSANFIGSDLSFGHFFE